MLSYQLTSMIIGVSIAATILLLVRRDHIHGSYAIWWLGTAVGVIVLAVFPRSVDWLAVLLGIAYPPILAMVLGLGIILIKILTMDVERSRQERKIRRLTQQLAILETRLQNRPEKTPINNPERESGDV